LDKYNQRWVFLVAPEKKKRWAITLWQTTYYTCSEAEVKKSPEWVRHERCHKQQWEKYGWRFPFMYLWELRKGYKGNRFEVEARQKQDTSGYVGKTETS
jgi:hypothetical protein